MSIETLLELMVPGRGPVPLVSSELQHEIEQFLFWEARLLDDRQYQQWYELVADDIHYWMPTRSNRILRELNQEEAGPRDVAHFDEDKGSLGWRVKRYYTGMAWAEDPPSRTRRLITNVLVQSTDREDEFEVDSNFLLYQNRLDTDVQWFVGRREDLLRRIASGQWQIAQRKIILDQNVIFKNVSQLL